MAALKLVVLILLTLTKLAKCGTVSLGGPCSMDNNRVDPATHKFLTDCDEKTFCAAGDSTTGTCQAKGCRRDEFPFGYDDREILPPLCDRGTFCPDEGSWCQKLIDVGQPCQMNRDEQCALPPNWGTSADDQTRDGAICLFSTCMHPNATLGLACLVDTNNYIFVEANGQDGNNTIIRHNCQTPQLYCDTAALQCVPSKDVGEECTLDMECYSQNCSANMCSDAFGTPRVVQSWQYAVTIFIVSLAMGTTVIALIISHKRLRLQGHRELREYYHEQISLRRSLFALHHTAARSAHTEKYSAFARSR
ncbi:hypothetical protein BDW22DRAFT_1330144 [Trametopsis cervina]|nr:hypothetical protein BDW22DRAFT_1330144 [Trametopsis cervina]